MGGCQRHVEVSKIEVMETASEVTTEVQTSFSLAFVTRSQSILTYVVF